MNEELDNSNVRSSMRKSKQKFELPIQESNDLEDYMFIFKGFNPFII